MDEDDPAALRARAAAAIAEVDEMLDRREGERIQRQMAGQHADPAQRPAPASAWTPPEPAAPEAPKPVHRATAPRERPAPAPPLATRISHTQHDEHGRISQVSTYSGDAATAAATWESWTRRLVRETADGLAAGIGEGVMEVFKAEREATAVHLAALTRRIEELERLAGGRQRREEFDVAAD